MKKIKNLQIKVVCFFLIAMILLLSFTACAHSRGDVQQSQETQALLGKDAYNILLLGFDQVSRSTDIMIVVSYRGEDGSATVMQIPRDTYVRYGDKGVKINSLYNVFASEGSEDTAFLQLSEFLSENLGIAVDAYAALDVSGAEKLVDSMGGVWVNVPYDLKYEDAEQELYIDIKAGEQLLDGHQAVNFLRYREQYTEGDIGRMDAQKIFLASLFSKLKNLSVKDKLALTATSMKYIKTNASLIDVSHIVANSKNMSSAVLFTLSGQSIYSKNDGKWYYAICKNDAENLINQYINQGRINSFDKSAIFLCEEDIAMKNIYLDKNFKMKIYTDKELPLVKIKKGE